MSDLISVQMRGDRELSVRFDAFPKNLHDALLIRITSLTDDLKARIGAATPYKTGALRSEETERVFGDVSTRVAGYVSIYAPGGDADGGNPYAKAATLEYGSDKPRRAFEKRSALLTAFGSKRKRVIIGRISKPVHIAAERYLRDPAQEMRSVAEAAIADTVAQVTQDANT